MEYYWILLSNKKEWNSDMWYSMGEPWTHYTKWKKPDKEVTYGFDSIYEKSRIGKSKETESRWAVARGIQVILGLVSQTTWLKMIYLLTTKSVVTQIKHELPSFLSWLYLSAIPTSLSIFFAQLNSIPFYPKLEWVTLSSGLP